MPDVYGWLKDFGQFFVTNPVAILSSLLVGGGIGYWLASAIADSKLKAKDDRIAGFETGKKEYQEKLDDLQSRLDDARKRLGIEPTGPHRYAAMTGQELQRCALNIAAALRDLLSDYKKTSDQAVALIVSTGSHRTTEQVIQSHQQMTQRIMRANGDLLNAYAARFRPDITVLYAELLKRGGHLVQGQRDFCLFNESMLDRPVNSHCIDAVSHALSSLAMTLPT